MEVVRLSENAVIPTRSSPRSVGFDLYSAYNYLIQPFERMLIMTDISAKPPAGCYLRIAPRSGLAWKHFLDVGAGTLDPDFTGNIAVLIFNFSKEPYQVTRHQRIAQIICEKVEIPEVLEVKTLPKSERGVAAFGSSGY